MTVVLFLVETENLYKPTRAKEKLALPEASTTVHNPNFLKAFYAVIHYFYKG